MAKASRSEVAEVERRSSVREALVLRIGVISSAERMSFCLVKNISTTGILVKLFGQVALDDRVFVRVGDEEAIAGRVAWVKDRSAGIEFTEELPPAALLRAAQKLLPTRRRSSPRINTAARVIVRTGGHCCQATLCDVSATGARVQLSRPIQISSTAMITLPDFPPMRAFVRWQDDRELGLAFETVIPIEVIANWVNDRVTVLP